MKSFIKLVLIFVLIFFNTYTVRALTDEFQLKGKSTLVLENRTSEAISIVIVNWYLLPWKAQEIDTTIQQGQSIELDIITQGNIYFNLKANDHDLELFTKPDAINEMLISEDGAIEFDGPMKNINNFINQKKDKLGSDSQPRANYTHGDMTFAELIKANDSLTALHQRYLKMNSDRLPSWYREIEQKRLQYLNAHWILNSLMYRTRIMKREDSIPDNFLNNTVASLSINDLQMLGNNRYMNFLSDYLAFVGDPYYQSPKPTNLEEWIQFYEHGFEIAGQELEGDVRDTYLAFALGNILERRTYVFQPEWIKQIQNPSLREYLRDLQTANPILPKGQKAPFFLLADSAGNKFSTADFEGKILLINFWATWCKPCIQEFPIENKLVEKYQNEPVAIVNICIDSDLEKWKSYVKKYKLETINIYAHENWNNKLQKDFGIKGIPHSVLIDWNGKVVQNKCRRASENVDLLINEQLEAMKERD